MNNNLLARKNNILTLYTFPLIVSTVSEVYSRLCSSKNCCRAISEPSTPTKVCPWSYNL